MNKKNQDLVKTEPGVRHVNREARAAEIRDITARHLAAMLAEGWTVTARSPGGFVLEVTHVK